MSDRALRTQADDLTIAYLAIGAADAIASCRGSALPVAVCDAYSGQMGFIGAVVSQALMLDQLADEREGELWGCFVYDVAEPFGKLYAKALIDGEPVNARKMAKEFIERGCS